MDEGRRGVDRAGRRAKRFLTPLQKYEIWLQLLRQEVTMAEAADSHQVDRSTIVRIREVAKQGALAALAESRPGTRAQARASTRPAAREPGSSRPVNSPRPSTQATWQVRHPPLARGPSAVLSRFVLPSHVVMGVRGSSALARPWLTPPSVPAT